MGWTEAHSAAGDNDIEALKEIKAAGANLEEVDGAGLTPLHVACSEGSLQAVQFLLEHTNSLGERSVFEGATPLHRAVEEGHESVVDALIEKGADVNLPNKEGYTPLHEAVRGQNLSTVELLLEKGCDVNVASNEKTTALHIAVEMSFLELIKPLVKAGANVHAEDNDSRTPASIAETVEEKDKAMRALGTMKPSIIMKAMEGFIARMQDRIFKESGMPLNSAERVLANKRFIQLFTFAEFLTFLDRQKYKDKSLAEVRKSDVEDDTWLSQCFGRDYYNCAVIFKEPLNKSELAQEYVTKCIKAQNGGKDEDDEEEAAATPSK